MAGAVGQLQNYGMAWSRKYTQHYWSLFSIKHVKALQFSEGIRIGGGWVDGTS